MKTRIAAPAFVAALMAGSMLGCNQSSEQQKRAADSAVAAAKTQASTVAGEVISARREAQGFFDSAHTSFVAKKYKEAAASLHEAAIFARQQSDSATGAAKTALAKSADEIENLSTRVARGRVTSVQTVDRAFARMQLAEAQHHYGRAMADWVNTNAGAASAELTMSIDHFERAVADAGLKLTSESNATVMDMRNLAADLAKGVKVDSSAFEKELDAFDREIQHVSTKVSASK